MAERKTRGRLVILCYHRVLPAERKARYFLPDLVVTPEAFRRQCALLRRRFEVMPLCQAYDALCAERTNRRTVAAITFDDGYRDNFRYAAPILAETGLKATFFVIAGLVGTDRPPWYDRLGRACRELAAGERIEDLMVASETGFQPAPAGPGVASLSPVEILAEAKKLKPGKRDRLVTRMDAVYEATEDVAPDDLIMNWQQLETLAAGGHEIASHGTRHEMLPQLDDASLDDEVCSSRRVLEQGLGRAVHSFCYPNGDVDARVAQAVETAGYTCAVTTEQGINAPGQNPFLLRRRFIHEDRLAGWNGSTSDTLLRTELCDLADRVFRRR